MPAAHAEFDPRGVSRPSTKVYVADDPRGVGGRRAAVQINQEREAFWRAGAGGDETAARIPARGLGYP